MKEQEDFRILLLKTNIVIFIFMVSILSILKFNLIEALIFGNIYFDEYKVFLRCFEKRKKFKLIGVTNFCFRWDYNWCIFIYKRYNFFMDEPSIC